MKSHVALIVLTLLICAGALAQSNDLTIGSATIVILHDAPSEIAKHNTDSQFAKFSADFEANAQRMAAALAQHPEITVVYSSAAKVSFEQAATKPVRREDIVTHWGYIFYLPGTAPVVYAGVVDDRYLVCQAAKYFTAKFEGYKCG
jgi:pterin-4a-carbinolamine dehydratase